MALLSAGCNTTAPLPSAVAITDSTGAWTRSVRQVGGDAASDSTVIRSDATAFEYRTAIAPPAVSTVWPMVSPVIVRCVTSAGRRSGAAERDHRDLRGLRARPRPRACRRR